MCWGAIMMRAKKWAGVEASPPKRGLLSRVRGARKVAALCGVAIVLAILAFKPAIRLVPFPAALRRPPPESPRLLDRNGTPLRELRVQNEKAFTAGVGTGGEIPESLQEAIVAAEDKRFFAH